MANDARSIQQYNDQLKIIFDDGTVQLALPTSSGGLWVAQRKLIPATPTAPVQSGNYIGIPNVTGVQYLDDGNPVSGTYYIAPGEHATVTALAKPGYALTSGTWEWEFDGPITPSSDYRFPFRRNLINFTSYFGHSGTDWPGNSVGNSSSIKCIGPGTVNGINPYTWSGNAVRVDHGTIDGINIWSLYAHMSSVAVGLGDVVTGGQTLGVIGNTGQSSGTHLHLEIIYNGARLPSDTPGNNTPGLGFQRTLSWMDSHTDGDNW